MGSDKFAVKKMEVCEICGAFLIVGDAQSRIGISRQHIYNYYLHLYRLFLLRCFLHLIKIYCLFLLILSHILILAFTEVNKVFWLRIDFNNSFNSSRLILMPLFYLRTQINKYRGFFCWNLTFFSCTFFQFTQKKFCPIVSAVWTFIGYKLTNRQSSQIFE